LVWHSSTRILGLENDRVLPFLLFRMIDSANGLLARPQVPRIFPQNVIFCSKVNLWMLQTVTEHSYQAELDFISISRQWVKNDA